MDVLRVLPRGLCALFDDDPAAAFFVSAAGGTVSSYRTLRTFCCDGALVGACRVGALDASGRSAEEGKYSGVPADLLCGVGSEEERGGEPLADWVVDLGRDELRVFCD